MMHKSRVFQVAERVHGQLYSTPGELARLLTEHTWCSCNGFKLDHLLFLNDSTGPDGAQEYAVFDTRIGKQVESLTVSWMTAEELELQYIRPILSGTYGGVEPWGALPSLEHPKGEPCYACR